MMILERENKKLKGKLNKPLLLTKEYNNSLKFSNSNPNQLLTLVNSKDNQLHNHKVHNKDNLTINTKVQLIIHTIIISQVNIYKIFNKFHR